MAYVSLLLMTAGIIALFLTGRKPRRIIAGLILAVLAVQCTGFLFFSGIMDKSYAVGWILAGLLAGGIFGFLIKLQHEGKKVYYTQRLEFSIIYMLLLLVNQLIAVFFQAYLPIVLFLSGLALGLYVGLHLIILMKTRKMLKTITVLVLLCMSLIVPSNFLNATAAGDATVFQNNSQGVAQAGIANGLDFQFTLPTGQQVNTAGIAPVSVNSPTSLLGVNSYYPEQMMIIIDLRGVLIPPDGWELWYQLESLGKQRNQVELDSGGNFAAEGIVRIYGKTWGDAGTQEFDYKETWDFVGNVNQSGCSVRITQPNGNFEEKYFEYPAGFFAGNNQAGAGEPMGEDSTTENSAGEQSGAQDSGQEPGDSNLFALQGVEEESADLAVTVSGALAGLAGLIAAFGTSLGTSLGSMGAALPAASIATSTPAQPEASLGAKTEEHAPEQPIPAGDRPAGDRPAGDRPAGDGDRSPVGSKREDGKIYTKNNGWQNEDFPGMQANSLKNEISTLQGDVQKYTQNGDKMRAEIARDQLKDSQRELKKWSEDASDINKAKSLDNEELYQGQGTRWEARESAMGTAATTASTISFAADMTLAVGTAGVSSVYSGAKTIGALKNAVSTVKTLTTVKEAASAGANIYDGYTQGKNMSDVITKEVINKSISLGVGKVFDAGKEQFGFVKYGADKAADSLKILVSTSESSAGNVAQGAFEDLGLNKGGNK